MKTVFIGDSIFAHFDLLDSIPDSENLSVPGHKIIDLYPQLTTLKRLNPEKAFILIGINDFLLKKGFFDVTMDTMFIKTYDWWLTLFTKHADKTSIYIISLLPISQISNETDLRRMNHDIDALNLQLKSLAHKHRAHFINAADTFKNSDNALHTDLTTDGIHLNQQTYQHFMAVLKPYIDNKAYDS